MFRWTAAAAPIVPVILSLVPGWGHIWLRRFGRGLLVFTVFVVAANIALMQSLAKTPTHASWIRPALAVAAAVFVFGIADVLRITLRRHVSGTEPRRRKLLTRALGHYVRDENGQAEEVLAKLVRLDTGRPAPWYYLGCVRAERGRLRAAKRAFRTARRVDRRGEWTDEIRLALQRFEPREATP